MTIPEAPDPAGLPDPPPAPPLPSIRPETAERASFEALMAKNKRVDTIKVPNPDGADLWVDAEAIGYYEYDKLVADCPPKESAKLNGALYDLEKFGPRLIAACATAPAMSISQAEQLWKNPAWSGGEIVGLFRRINELCQRGLEVPFIAPG